MLHKFAIGLFMSISLLFVFTIGSFQVSPVGVACAILTLLTFWTSTHLVAKFRDGPAFNLYRYMVKDLQQLGALFVVLAMWVLVSIPVSLAIWAIASIMPQAFHLEPEVTALIGNNFRAGFGITLVFGFMKLIGDFPMRLSTTFKTLAYLKEIRLT